MAARRGAAALCGQLRMQSASFGGWGSRGELPGGPCAALGGQLRSLSFWGGSKQPAAASGAAPPLTIDGGAGAAAVAAAGGEPAASLASAAASAAGQAPPLDLAAILDAANAAEVAAIVAAKEQCWTGAGWYIDLLETVRSSYDLPWRVRGQPRLARSPCPRS
jgi:hypothetical protein